MTSESANPVTFPDFDSIADLFVELGSLNSPAELHGILCGQLASGVRLSEPLWLQSAEEALSIDPITDPGHQQPLVALYQSTLNSLEGTGFGFPLLLPEEETPLDQRGEALGQWCHGFLCGYTLSGASKEQLGEDAASALEDFAHISQIAVSEEGGEEDEADFMEVSEYVRMAALLIFAECNVPQDQAKTTAKGDVLH